METIQPRHGTRLTTPSTIEMTMLAANGVRPAIKMPPKLSSTAVPEKVMAPLMVVPSRGLLILRLSVQAIAGVAVGPAVGSIVGVSMISSVN